VAVDVDLGESLEGGKRAAAKANLEALSVAARILRLKGEGGLVVVDLAGRGHNGRALLEAARSAFAPDQPGVAIGPISRFGTIELAVPRRRRSIAERLLDAAGRPTSETLALRLLRAIEREALAQPGSRIEARASPDVAGHAARYLKELEARFGARLALAADPALGSESFEVVCS
jgi:Ribonuclease G/E